MDAAVARNIKFLLDCGNRDRANALSTDALKVAARGYGDKSVEYGAALIAHADVQSCKGHIREAESLLTEAVSLLEQHEVSGRRALVEALIDLGNISHLLGNAKNAEGHTRRALDMLSPLEPSHIAPMARALLALGHILQSADQHTDAETAFRQAYDLCTRFLGSENSTSITAANALADHLLLIDEFEEAKPIIGQTWQKTQALLDESHPEFAAASAMMGRLLAEEGDSKNAESFLRRSATLSGLYRGKDSLEAGDASLSLGVFLMTSGQISEAALWIQKALAIYEHLLGKESRIYARALVAMGRLLMASREYGRASEMYLAAYRIDRDIVGPDHPACVDHLLRIANLCQLTGSEKDALWAYNEAVQIAGNTYGPNHPAFSACMVSFSSMLVDSGHATRALEMLERAQRICKAIYGKQHPSYLACVFQTALAHMAVGDLHAGKELLMYVAQVYAELSATSHPRYAHTLLALAAIAVQEHRPDRALSLIGEAMAVETQIAHHVFLVTSEAQREGMVAHLSMYPALTLSLTAQYLPNDATAMTCAFNSIVRQKGIDGEIHLLQRISNTRNDDPSLRDRMKRLHTLRKRLAAMLLTAEDGTGLDTLAIPGELQEQIKDIETDLARSMPLVSLTRALSKTDADTVLSHIPEDAVLIEFACSPAIDFSLIFQDSSSGIGPDRYYALVASPVAHKSITLIDLGDATIIDAYVHRLRDSLSHNGGECRGIGVVHGAVTDDTRAVACDLKKALLAPILAVIGETRHLIISPDAELNLLPFGILPLDDGRPLVDRYVVEYVGSSRELIRFGEDNEETTPGNSMVVADPDFDFSCADLVPAPTVRASTRLARAIKRSETRFPLLPGTREEGERVAELLPGATLILGHEATVHRIMELRAPRILHIATHGYFCADEPAESIQETGVAFFRRLRKLTSAMREIDLYRESNFLRSGLVFSGVNAWAKGDDTPYEMRSGILTAMDVLGMDLIGTDLVVLSACDTGLGTMCRGQGVFGLRRAFALAGAKSLVMTLWRVNDQVTKDLMIEFYQCIVNGYPKAAALTEAQRRLKKKYPDPSAWGAFIFQGDPGPVQGIGTAD